jgi:hypothetical protein
MTKETRNAEADVDRLEACWRACAAVNADNPVAAAEAIGILMDVARRTVEGFGGYIAGPQVTDAPLERAARAAYHAALRPMPAAGAGLSPEVR